MNRQIAFSAPYNPYDDSFFVNQNQHKVLLKPGHNVDHSHLNLIQSVLQEQVARFGQHVFVNGSFVTGGQYTQVRDAVVLDIVDLRGNELNTLKRVGVGNWILEDNGQTIAILSVDTEKENSPEVHKLLISKDTPLEIELIPDKHYTIYNVANPNTKLNIKKASDFQYIVFDEGVLFVNGYFISIPKQYAIVRYASSSVGFLLEQNIISYFDDISLLDNSSKDAGSFEGADRLQLQLELASFSIPKLKTNYNLARGSFFEFLKLDNWEVIKDLTKTQYSKNLSQMIERRTYDKSGNYTVTPFKINIKNDTDLEFKIEISPGKAYIFGYEFDSISTKSLPLVKDSGLLAEQSNTLAVPTLPYLVCPTLDKFIPIQTDVPVKFYDSDGEQIGTGFVGYIKQVSDKVRLYLSSFTLNSGKSLYDTTTVRDFNEDTLASIELIVVASNPTRLVTLDQDEKLPSILRIEDLLVQKVFEDVTNNLITFDSNETPPTDVSNYLTFQSNGMVGIIDDISIEDKVVSLISAKSIDKVIVSGVKLTVTHSVASESEITIQVPFSTTINLPYKIKKVLSATNNQETITSLFTVSERVTEVSLLGSSLTYTGIDTRSGNLLLTLLVTTYNTSTLRIDNSILDLRQSTYFTFPLIEPNSPLKLYYDVKQARYDKLVLTKDGTFELIQGTPHPYKPVAPKDRIDAMTLYTLYIPGSPKSPEDVGVKYIENKRYTMRDIGKLEKRIENLEYYNLLSLLEKETSDQTYKDENGLDRFKNGFMVDNFKTYKGVDFKSPDCLFSLDLQQGHLRPSFEMENVGVETSFSNIPLLSCPYTETILLDQNQASSTLNLNPYEVFTWQGQVTLYPPLDYWVDTTVKPDITLDHKGEFDVYATFKEKGFTSEWGVWDSKILDFTSSDLAGVSSQDFAGSDLPTEKRLWIPDIDPSATPELIAKYNLWVSSGFVTGFSITTPDGYVDGKPAILLDFKGQKVQKSADLTHFGDSAVITSSLGTTVRDVGFSPYIRAKSIQFTAKGLKPNTKFFVTFSDVDVSNLCSGGLMSSSNGSLSGVFSLPAGRFKNGQHQFKLIDTLSQNSSQVTSFAIAEYTANGMQSTVQETFISTREPQTTTESVSFTEVSAVFDSTVLTVQNSITINQFGTGLVELYDSAGSTPIVVGKDGESVYYTAESGKNYILRITETVGRVSEVSGLDYYDSTQTKGVRQGSFLFDGDKVITARFADESEKILVQFALLDFNTSISDSELSPYYKLTLNRFPDYEDEITYLQYRKPTANVSYPEEIVFPLSNNRINTDVFEITGGDSVTVEFITTGTTGTWANDSVTWIDYQTIKWDKYGSTVISKTFTQTDISAVVDKNAIELMYLFNGRASFLTVRSKTNGSSFLCGVNCYLDENNTTTPLHTSQINPKFSNVYEVGKIFNEFENSPSTGYLIVSPNLGNFDVTISVSPYFLNAQNVFIPLPIEDLDSGYGIDISDVPLATGSRNIFLDFMLDGVINVTPTPPTPPPTPTPTPPTTTLISLLDDPPITNSLDDYPIDPLRTCTFTLKLPLHFVSEDIDVSGILFINDIDAATIIKDGTFTYQLDPVARKASLRVMKFDCPFNTRITIDLRMNSAKPYNLALDHTLTDQPFMRDTVKEYRYPNFSRKGTFLVNLRNQIVTLNMHQVIRTTCIPGQAKRTGLVQVPMVIQYASALNQTMLINGVNLEDIFANPEKSPFAFRTMEMFVGNRNYVADFRAMSSYVYPGPSSKTEVFENTPIGSGTSTGGFFPHFKQIFIIWYVPYNSLFTVSSPFVSSEPKYIISPLGKVQGPYTYGYHEYTRVPGDYSQNYQQFSFKFFRNNDQKGFSGIYSKQETTRTSTYLISKDMGLLFEFCPLKEAEGQDFSNFEPDASDGTRSTDKYKVMFFPGAAYINKRNAERFMFFPDYYEKGRYTVVSENDDRSRFISTYYGSGLNPCLMNNVEALKYVYQSITAYNLGGVDTFSYYKVIKILDSSFTQATKYYIKRYTINLNSAKNKDFIESTTIPGDNYTSFIPTNGFVPITTTSVEYNNMSLLNRTKLLDAIRTSPAVIQSTPSTSSSTNLAGFTEISPSYTPSTTTTSTAPKVCLTDPLAQSFFIDGETHPEGVVLSSIDLFFRKKDSSHSVMLELRSSVNGYPSSKEVIPFSRSYKEAEDIEVSEDASVPTNFKFEGLVYLKPGEYHFVVISKSLNYDVWVGRLGEFILGDETKGRVDKNPYAGVLFKSSNNTAWLPDSEADFTFRINRCKFTTGETVLEFSSNTYQSKGRTAQPLSITTIKPAFSSIIPEGSRISKSLVTLTNKDTLVPKEFSIPLNGNYDLDEVYTISDTKFDSTNRILHKIGLTTTKDHISPLIDWQRSSYVLVNNLINSIGTDDTSELQPYGGLAKARYITKPMRLNLEIPANNLRLEFAANCPGSTSVKVFYRVFNTLHDSNGLTIVDKNWIFLGTASKIPKDKDTFIDFAFESPNPIPYPGIANLTEFDVCQVKLVMDSSNPAFVPRVKDFRLIALSS